MKKLTICLNIAIVLCMFVSCDSENKNLDEDDYSFSFAIIIKNINQDNLLSQNKSDNKYCKGDITVKPLQSNDHASFDIEEYPYGNQLQLKINLDSYGPNGKTLHRIAIEWNHDSKVTTDTIVCEINKYDKTVLIKNIWVNNTLQQLYDISSYQLIQIIKTDPATPNLYDANNNNTRVEKEIDNLKFTFWLSDRDGYETNLFSEEDVKERGFAFNISLTNNSEQTIYISNDFGRPLGKIFNTENIFIGSTCAQSADILIIYSIKPGETHAASQIWCPYNKNILGADKVLPAGKYYTYFNQTLPYYINYTIDGYDARHIIEIPIMIINIEIKK
ncbi:MAG: hypothetical protein LBV74_00675 [Tannerella sp.]|jgi:hypothetical protein|nr:hypothetical protein [Tannerella sp.]